MHISYNLLVYTIKTTTTKAGWGKSDACQGLIDQVVIKTNRSDKTEIKKFLKISGHQQRWPRPFPGAILIPPALLVVADSPTIIFTANIVYECFF
jgi:hypothetical protein